MNINGKRKLAMAIHRTSILYCFCQSKIIWLHGNCRLAIPTHNFKLAPAGWIAAINSQADQLVKILDSIMHPKII
jgi:hypothetical protein